MVQLVFSPETLITCVQKILKHSNWRELTPYYKHNLFPVQTLTINNVEYTLCRHNDGWYLRHDREGVLLIPTFVGESLKGINRFTYWYGPYAFVNNFENTVQGRYLVNMLDYPRLNPRAKEKIRGIMDKYGYWVQEDASFLETLRRRDLNAKRQN